ncbi:hypothetical protein VCHA53O466_140163 [Vibrio chagasii]|nr:hypothetical protein VCHA53O466_140163 [Vibrio chagasii]
MRIVVTEDSQAMDIDQISEKTEIDMGKTLEAIGYPKLLPYLENVLFNTASRYSQQYNGGRWKFVVNPSNECCPNPFLAFVLMSDKEFTVDNPNGMCTETLSTEEFSVLVSTVTNLTLQNQIATTPSIPDESQLEHLFYDGYHGGRGEASSTVAHILD